MYHRTRSITVAAACAVVAFPAVATAAPATPHLAASPSSVAAAQLAGTRSVAVPGVPVKLSIPSNFSTCSPKQVYDSKTKNYPACIRYLAKLSSESVTTFLSKERNTNLIAYGPATRNIVPTVSAIQVNAVVSQAQLASVLKSSGQTVTTSSKVPSRLGTVARVHYRGRTAHGYTAYGVAGSLVMGSKSLLIDSGAYAAGPAAANSTSAIKGLARR